MLADIQAKDPSVEAKISQENNFTKELMICFLTIRDYRNLLFLDEIDFDLGLTKVYAHEIMRVDFNTITRILVEFQGADRKGIVEAKQEMDKATKKLYKALGTYKQKPGINPSEVLEIRAEAWIECRNFLQEAYLHLQHLEVLAVELNIIPNPNTDDKTSMDKPSRQ